MPAVKKRGVHAAVPVPVLFEGFYESDDLSFTGHGRGTDTTALSQVQFCDYELGYVINCMNNTALFVQSFARF